MTLAPLLNTEPTIQVHTVAAIAAFALGLVQFAAPKGTVPHRALGWAWVSLMRLTAVASFFIHQIRMVGPWSPIHLLSVVTLVGLAAAVWAARTHDVAKHRRIMLRLFLFALVIAGLFTFAPGRIMHAVLFGA